MASACVKTQSQMENKIKSFSKIGDMLEKLYKECVTPNVITLYKRINSGAWLLGVSQMYEENVKLFSVKPYHSKRCKLSKK